MLIPIVKDIIIYHISEISTSFPSITLLVYTGELGTNDYSYPVFSINYSEPGCFFYCNDFFTFISFEKD